MDSLLTLIDNWHAVAKHAEDKPDDPQASEWADNARRTLELRLAELTGYLDGMNMAAGRLSRPLLLLRGDQPS